MQQRNSLSDLSDSAGFTLRPEILSKCAPAMHLIIGRQRDGIGTNLAAKDMDWLVHAYAHKQEVTMRAVMLAGAVFALAPAALLSQAFTFETAPSGAHSSYSTTVGGQTLSVASEGPGFVFFANPGVPLLGSRSAIGTRRTVQAFDDFVPLRFSFSAPVDFVRFLFGDGGGDNDSPVFVDAYTSGGTHLGTLTGSYPASFGGGSSLTGTYVTPASYFVVSSTPGSNDHSLYWEVADSRIAGVVPEPSTILLLGSGLLVVGAAVRRRR